MIRISLNSKHDESIHGREALGQASVAIAQQASRDIFIFSDELNPSSYNQACFLHCIKTFVLRSHHCHVKILIQSPKQIIRKNHQLLNFGRQFSSRIHFKGCHQDEVNLPENFLLTDKKSYLFQTDKTKYEAVTNTRNTSSAQ